MRVFSFGCQALQNIFRAYTEGILFAGSKDVCQNNDICHGKYFGKIIQKSFGAGVGVWLEYQHQTLMRIFLRGGQCSADLCRMMCISSMMVTPSTVPLYWKRRLAPWKASRPLMMASVLIPMVQARAMAPWHFRHVSSGNGKFDFTDGLFVVHGGKRRTGFVIICQIICIIFTGIIKTVGDDLLWKSVGQFLMVCNFSIDNGCSVCQCIAGKFTERTTDVVDILEKVQMFCFYI
mgnify:CR=1 FL=1